MGIWFGGEVTERAHVKLPPVCACIASHRAEIAATVGGVRSQEIIHRPPRVIMNRLEVLHPSVVA